MLFVRLCVGLCVCLLFLEVVVVFVVVLRCCVLDGVMYCGVPILLFSRIVVLLFVG